MPDGGKTRLMTLKATLFTAAALLLMGAAAQARAETTKLQPIKIEAARVGAVDLSQPATQSFIAPSPRKTVQLDTKGRWGLRLDMNTPTDRVEGMRDVQAGAYFRITPSLKVGGTVGITDKLVSAPAIKPQETPRVHLETAFRF
jgi:hypothetical protein